jgi:hypothetical protein
MKKDPPTNYKKTRCIVIEAHREDEGVGVKWIRKDPLLFKKKFIPERDVKVEEKLSPSNFQTE